MADRYWVGGTAAWDGTAGTKWSATSGGAGGASVPTSADAVFFNAASGAGTVTVSSGGGTALSINCTGFTGTIAGSSAINVSGNVTLVSGQGFTHTGGFNFAASATLISGGKTLGSIFIAVGTLTLGSALTASVINLSGTTFNTSASNFSVTLSSSLAATAGTLTLNGSTITLTGSFTASATTTVNAGTSTINMSTAGSNFAGGGKTYNNLSFTSTTVGGNSISGVNTFTNLTLTAPSASGVSTFSFSSNQTITTFVCSGASAIRRIELVGSPTTLTVTTWATISDIDFRSITMNSSRSGTRLGNGGGNTNITFPAAKTVYWNLAGAQSWSANGWATTAGGTPAVNNFPLAQDTATFTDTGSVTGIITADGGFYCGSVDMSTRTTAMTLNISSIYLMGNWTNGSGTTISGGTLNFYALSGFQTIASAGKTFTGSISITDSASKTIILSDALTTNGTFTCPCSLILNNNTLTANNFASNTATTRAFDFGSGNITVIGTGASAININGSGLTNSGTPVINVTYSGASAMTVTTTSIGEVNSISFNFSAGTYALTFANNSSARDLNFTGFSGSFAASTILQIFGNITLSTGMTIPTGSSFFLSSTSGTKTITSNGKAIVSNLTVFGVGGTWQLQDALTVSGAINALTFVNGTLNLNGQTATAITVVTQTGTKNLTFNGGTLVVAGTTNAFNNAAPTGFTTTAGTGTGTIRMSAATAKTFVGGGSTYNCTLDQGGAGALTITGANTFSNITNSYNATGATSIFFTAGTTTTFADWNASGQSGRLLTIGSVTAASHTLSKSTGIVGANFLSVSRSTATGGATWYAGASSTDGGNNTGWIFSNAPGTGGGGNFIAFFM